MVLAQTRKDNVLSKPEQRFELWVTSELTVEAKGNCDLWSQRYPQQEVGLRIGYEWATDGPQRKTPT